MCSFLLSMTLCVHIYMWVTLVRDVKIYNYRGYQGYIGCGEGKAEGFFFLKLLLFHVHCLF